jgi:hypothetical protein
MICGERVAREFLEIEPEIEPKMAVRERPRICVMRESGGSPSSERA